MINCSKAKELLSSFYDGELDDDQQLAISNHVECCESCSSELSGYAVLSNECNKIEDVSPPAAMWTSLESQIALQQAPKSHSTKPAKIRFTSTSKIFVIVATLLIAVSLGWVGISSWISDEQGNT